jgi:hypothetical protein
LPDAGHHSWLDDVEERARLSGAKSLAFLLHIPDAEMIDDSPAAR